MDFGTKQPKAANAQFKSTNAPVPPNDNVIHVSQCKNSMCPLQEVLKMTAHKNNDNFEHQFIPFYGCPKCQGEQVKYCSQRCFQQDWFKTH